MTDVQAPSEREVTLAEALGRLSRERTRSEFRAHVLESLVLYLFTYESTIEKVRLLLEKVETQALRNFPDLHQAGWRWDAARDLFARLQRIEDSSVAMEERLAPVLAEQRARLELEEAEQRSLEQKLDARAPAFESCEGSGPPLELSTSNLATGGDETSSPASAEHPTQSSGIPEDPSKGSTP